MTAPELQVLVAADLARAPHVAAVPGLPELIAAEAVATAYGLAGFLEDLAVGPPISAAAPGVCASASDAWYITATHGLARLFAAVGWRESLLGRRGTLSPDGSGDGEHGWGPWQADVRAFPQLVEAIRAMVPWGPEWWQVSAHGCMPILLGALQEYPGNLEAGVCRYNASRAGVDAGLAAGDPNLHTTGKNYGRDVLATVIAWWPS